MRSLSKERIQFLLQKYSVTPRKKRGQSFLTDPSVALEIVRAAEVGPDDRILEIGGGLGILTEILAKYAKKVHVIEIEPGLVRAIREELGNLTEVEVIEGDALKVPLPEISKVVANLPYSIASPITFRILQELDFELAVLMYQEEFADRLISVPGTSTYSRLSIDFQYLAEASEVLTVPASKFYPVPAINSKVLRIKKRTSGPFARNHDVFFWFVHGIYSYPNKQLRRALGIWLKNMKRDKKLVDEILARVGDEVTGGERLRGLTQEMLVNLSDVVSNMITEDLIHYP
ncbi:MAG: 16S rRNA (adenine(1518)-N(6)/adenine(1519)-N(6))-dimethyltransferase RsmA [Candidatus Hodarchaeota archaeon]